MSGLEVIGINYIRGKGGLMFRKGREIVDRGSIQMEFVF
jgi:hypothetical protein